MIKGHKLIATFFGIGYIRKGAGTVAAVLVCIFWLLIAAGNLTAYWQVFITIFVCIAGVWSANAVDVVWGKDSNRVVIDEVAGMLITLIAMPANWKYVLAGLIFFRFFDILKPLFIRRLEALPKGWGVVADDVLAGIYAHVLLATIAAFKLL